MTIYYIISIIFFLLSLFELYIVGGSREYKILKTASLWPIGAVLICIAGFRYMVGADYTSYRVIFTFITRFHSLDAAIAAMGVMEPAFVAVNYLFKNFDYNVFLFVFAIPSIFLKLRFISKYSQYFFLGLLLYLPTFLEGDMGIIRQYFALAIVFFSVDFIIKRQFLPYLLLMIIAFNFHRSAIAFFPAYFLIKINFNYWHALILVVVLQVTSFISMDLLQPVAQLNSFMYGKFQDYTNNKDLGFSIKDMARIFIVFLLCLNQKAIKQDKLLKIFSSIFIWGCIIYALLKFNSAFAQRLTLYYLRFEIVLLPMLLYFLRDHLQNILKLNIYRACILIYAVIVLCYKIIILIPWNDNYQTIFFATNK